jgi:UDP-N-acetylglucosamine 2-epimerase (non-hydrolysing)
MSHDRPIIMDGPRESCGRVSIPMKSVALVFGTRPEAIKLAPIERVLRDHPTLRCVVCVTGQHRQMLDQVLEVFEIPVHADLDLMRDGQSPTDVLVRSVAGIDQWLQAAAPDLVLVQGDTTTALGASLAAFYRGVPVGHVEAGLRTHDLSAPWPEEANRQVISRLAYMHFAPTEVARANLLAEGIPGERIEVTGNSVVDALLIAHASALRTRPTIPGVPETLLESARVVLITGHRRENFGGPLEKVCRAIRTLAARFPDVAFIYPVHLNPLVREVVGRLLGGGSAANVHVIEPLGYLPFVRLLSASALVITDSGGIQEEAPTFGVPVLVTRKATERTEAVAAGVAQIVGTDESTIVAAASRHLKSTGRARSNDTRANPFGDGHAAQRIVDACATFLDRGVANEGVIVP